MELSCLSSCNIWFPSLWSSFAFFIIKIQVNNCTVIQFFESRIAKALWVTLSNSLYFCCQSLGSSFSKNIKHMTIVCFIFVPWSFCRNLTTISKEHNSFYSSIFIPWYKSFLDARGGCIITSQNCIRSLIGLFTPFLKCLNHTWMIAYILISGLWPEFLNKFRPEPQSLFIVINLF